MLSIVFTFAPIPLTDELNPLAVAADLARRRQADKAFTDARPRHRITPVPRKMVVPETPTAGPETLIAA
jgi:hypothetical protein